VARVLRLVNVDSVQLENWEIIARIVSKINYSSCALIITAIITAFNNTSRYLDNLLNIDNNHVLSLVNNIYPHELQLNKANTSDKQANILQVDLYLSSEHGYVTTKIYDKGDEFI
jgi:predicted PurR-regulated permease PerM